MSSPSSSRAELVRDLNRRMQGIEQSRQRLASQGAVSTGIAPLDQLLPEAGFRWGGLTEWLGEGAGSGAMTLALLSLASILQGGGALVVIDPSGEFYPPAASGLGIDLNHTVLVRPSRAADVLWAWEQILQCPGVTVALGVLETLPDRAFRRLQLAVERGGGIGFLIRPAEARRHPSWAEVRLLVRPLPSTCQSSGRRLRLELLQCRGGSSGEAVELEISHETGLVHLASGLASATAPARQARA